MNPLNVSAAAPPGATVSITAPITAGPATQLTRPIETLEDQAIVVSVAGEAGTSQYWVRCLPHDFPRLSMIPHPSAGTPTPGYYVVGDTFFAKGESGYAMLLDMNGTPVWYGRTSTGAGAKTVELLDSTTVAYVPIAGYTFGTYEGAFELHSLSPVAVQQVTSVGVPVDTHELRQTPNGNFLLFASPVVTGVNLTGLDRFVDDEDILDCVIQEVTPSGQVVWHWDAMDHFDPAQESTYPVTTTAVVGPGRGSHTVVDTFHCNSIDLDPAGNLLVSARDMDALFLISYATGDVLWKMGGTPYNKGGAPHLTVAGGATNAFFRQHDARFQPNGTISLFDDQTGKPGPARALVLSYDVTSLSAQIIWSYVGAASVGSMGSLTILPDGSRVIGWGEIAGQNPAFTEVTEDGKDLLDFSFPDSDSSYRALKVPLSAVDLGTLRAAVGAWSSGTGLVDAGTD